MARHLRKEHHKHLNILGIVAILFMLFVIATSFDSTGKFTGEFGSALNSVTNPPEPQVFATANDIVYVSLTPYYNPGDSVVIESPNGKTMVITTTQLAFNRIAKVRFDGTVELVRSEDCGQVLPNNSVTVVGNLVGAAVDGTWTIKNTFSALLVPHFSALRLEIQGKIFDDVSSGEEPIEGCGRAWSAGSPFVAPKTWNWHMQTAQRYDTYNLGTTNTVSTTNPEENPLNARFFLTGSVTQPTFSDGFEDGTLAPFTGDWLVVQGGRARSSAISDSATSLVSLSRTTSTGTISFTRKISSEKGYDFLRFYIDGVKMDEWSGEKDWEEVSYPITTGQHTFEWRYEKDTSRSEGEDAAWIDSVVIREVAATSQPSSFSDNFDDGIPFVNGNARWVEYNPSEGSFLETQNAMRIKGAYGHGLVVNGVCWLGLSALQLTGSVLVLDNYMWGSYSAEYDTTNFETALNELNPRLGGFTVRYRDSLNFIAIQPTTPGANSYAPTLMKIRNGLKRPQDIIVTHQTVSGGWPSGHYKIVAVGNVYTVYINDIKYLEFIDTQQDFIEEKVGLYFLPGNCKYLHDLMWDNFQITAV